MDEYTNNDAFYAAAAAASADVSNTLNVWNTNLSNERIARENREYQYNSAVNMWNMQNEYNSPKEAMQRLSDAGINPFVAAAQVANVNHAGELHPPTQQGIPAQPFMPAASGFSQMAAALAQLADASNKSKQTELLERTISSKVRQELNIAEKQEFDLYLDHAFAGIERNARLKELHANISKLHEEAFRAKEEGDLFSMQYQLANAQRYLTELKSHEQLKRNDRIEEILQYEIDELQAAIDEHRAGAFEKRASGVSHYADAAYTKEQTKLAEDIHDSIVRIRANESILSDKDVVKYYERHEDELHLFMQQVRQAEIVTETLQVQLEQALLKKDFQLVHEILDVIDQSAGIITRTNRERSQTRSYDRSNQDYDEEVITDHHDGTTYQTRHRRRR